MAATTNADFVSELRERWNKFGPPVEIWNKTGEFWKMLPKAGNFDGDGTMKVGVDTALNGNVGAAYEQAFANQLSSSGVQYDVNKREKWAIMKLGWNFLSSSNSSEALISRRKGKEKEAKNVAAAWHKACSYQVWTDGTGRLSKGDGAYDVGSNVITLLNRATINRFEKGDLLVFNDPAEVIAGGGQMTPRDTLATVTIDQVNRAKGTITTVEADISAAITGATNADYIGKLVDFVGAGQDGSNGPVDGVFRWIPITNTDAEKDLFGVTRADDVSRLSGFRFNVTPGDSPWTITTRILRESRDLGNPTQSIWLPLNEMRKLSEEMKANGVHVTKTDTRTSVKQLMMGVSVVEAVFPGHAPVQLISDKYMADIDLSEDDDRTYLGVPRDAWTLHTGPEGLGWVEWGTDGKLLQITGKQTVFGSYGAFGNLICNQPGNHVLASSRADL